MGLLGLCVAAVKRWLVWESLLFCKVPKKARFVHNSSVSVCSILKGLLSTVYPSLQKRHEGFSARVPRIKLPLGHYCWEHL